MLRIAIQKSGRLSEKSLDIIRKCGISFGSDSRVLKETASNFPIEFLYVRDDDIPSYVEKGVADIGIVGRNEYDEQNIDLDVVKDLQFAKCRLSIAVPNEFEYEGLKSLEGLRIATSYPNILGRILKERGVSAELVMVSGSVEISPSIGTADVICDIVSTGTTLKMNGLREVETIYTSSAIMVATRNLCKEKRDILDRLILRIDAVMKAQNYKYIMFNLPKKNVEKCSGIIGGMKSPTVLELVDKDWVAIQSVVHEDRFWEIFEKLRELGAQGLLVTPIEKLAE